MSGFPQHTCLINFWLFLGKRSTKKNKTTASLHGRFFALLTHPLQGVRRVFFGGGPFHALKPAALRTGVPASSGLGRGPRPRETQKAL
jgi:hypothetical protein